MTLTAADESHQAWATTTRTLRAFVARRVESPEAADDITQDILVRVLRSGRGDALESTPGWLFTVARNAVIDHYRARRPLQPLPTDLAESLRNEEPDPDALAELAGCLVPAVSQLPERYSTALRLVELEGLAQAEAAAEVGISLSGMKSRVQRGRRMLRALIESWCAVEFDGGGRVASVSLRDGRECRCG